MRKSYGGSNWSWTKVEGVWSVLPVSMQNGVDLDFGHCQIASLMHLLLSIWSLLMRNIVTKEGAVKSKKADRHDWYYGK